MKLRNPVIIKVAALLASWAFRFWLGSVTYRFHRDDPSIDPAVNPRRSIYLFWHEMMLVPAYTHARRNIAVLVSHHADGELISTIIHMMGGGSVRGSTSKRGLSALRGMMRRGKLTHIAITPDGPRGPRRVVQPGAIYLASRTGMPIIPVGFDYARCYRHRSWDRMALPYPGAVARGVLGTAIEVPPDLDRDGIEAYRRRVQAALDAVQARAESTPAPAGTALATVDVSPAGASRYDAA